MITRCKAVNRIVTTVDQLAGDGWDAGGGFESVNVDLILAALPSDSSVRH